MFEKVNPSHPDKIADRIAGAIVDLAYKYELQPSVAVEVMIGHGICDIQIESDFDFDFDDIHKIVNRIAGKEPTTKINIQEQDKLLHNNQYNQYGEIKCGDNGIFKGCPTRSEQKRLSDMAKQLYKGYPYDGKFIIDRNKMIVCQSHMKEREADLIRCCGHVVNPLGEWTGGTDVDTGCTNRKLGSDMGDAVTGGGLHGKDLSKADVTLNIMCHILAQRDGTKVYTSCGIGDTDITFRNECDKIISKHKYSECVEAAKALIDNCGGFEKFAEWGLI